MTTMVEESAAVGSFLLEGVSWKYYDQTLRELERAGRRLRVTYDDGRMEFMTLGDLHERAKSTIRRLIELYALERDIDILAMGSITCRRKSLKKGLEPDEAYYVNAPHPPVSEGELDLNQYQPPDLAVEVDISRSSIKRQPIYAALGVAEVWRYDGRALRVLRRDKKGKYVVSERSLAFRDLPMDVLNRHLKMSLGEGQAEAIKAFRDWVRANPER
jgi:Uma2 family endonuclease